MVTDRQQQVGDLSEAQIYSTITLSKPLLQTDELQSLGINPGAEGPNPSSPQGTPIRYRYEQALPFHSRSEKV